MDKFESGPRVRRLVDRRLEGHPGLRHAADAGSGDAAYIDPFMDETTLNITCDVIEPSDGKGYERDPRSLAKRAEAYLKSTGLGDIAYFGPEPEFFIFDAVEWSVDMSGSYCKIFSAEAPWSSAEKFEGGNMGHRPPVKGGYFPVPPVDSLQDIRSAMCLALEQMGVEVEVHHHEVAAAGQNEIGTKFAPLVKRADWLQILKYAVHNTAHAYGKTATFMPKPIVGDNGSGMHVHQSVWKDGKNLFAGDGYSGLSDFALYYIGGVIKHAKALNAITNPGHQFVQAPGAGLRGADQPRVLGAQPLGGDPHSVRVEPEGPAHRSALPGSDGESVPRVRGDADGGLDGVQNKIHPGDPMDKNLYDLEPEEAAKVPHPCASLDEALDHLDERPRVPDEGRRVHRRHDRRVHRAQDGGGHALPDDDASGRVRHVLQPVSCHSDADRRRAGAAARSALFACER